jgi:hypothetical protein
MTGWTSSEKRVPVMMVFQDAVDGMKGSDGVSPQHSGFRYLKVY